jgi:general secretion pathway protein A
MPSQQRPLIRHDLFGLTHTPFIDPPAKPWLDDSRSTCMANLTSFLQTRGFAAIAGKPGNGKTAIVKYFVENLHQPSHQIVYVPMCHLSENDLLKLVCMRLEITLPYGRSRMLTAIQQRIDDLQPINPVIVFDEMQNATSKCMDLIRMLANDHFDPTNTLSCIMIGTSEFFDKLRLTINESLRERITSFHVVDPLDETASADYVRYCLAQAGAEQPIFDPPALKLIYDLSGGVLRVINKVAAAAMIYASEQQSSEVILEHVHAVKEQVKLPGWKVA